MRVRRPFASPLRHLGRGLALLAPLALAATQPACGKEENVHDVVLVEFPHSFPEAPRPLSQATQAPANGRAIAATERHLYLVDRDNRAVVRLDRATLARQLSTPLDGRPEQLVISRDGRVFVTMRSTGELIALSPDLVIERRVKLGVEAHGVALSTDSGTAYVSLPRDHELVTLDTLTLEELDRATMLDTPRGVAVSPNGWVLVTHEHGGAVRVDVDAQGLPLGGVADVRLRGANPTDHMTGARLGRLTSTRALAAAVNPEDGSAYVAHVAAAPGTESDFLNQTVNTTPDAAPVSDGYGSSVPSATFSVPTRPVEVAVTVTSPSGTQGMVEADFPVQDPLTGEPLAHLVDQPSDVNHHPSWSLLFMTGYGTDNVLVMSTAEGDPLRSTLGLIEVGRAPRGITFSPDGATAYVLNEHDLSVSVIDLAPLFALPTMADGSTVFDSMGMDAAPQGASFAPFPMDPGAEFASTDPTPRSPRVRPVRLEARTSAAYASDPLPPEVRRGARVFTFARNENLSHAGQFACASCHFEGTEDKLVWFISDGPRQTPSLAGRLAGTAPFNWAGTKDALQDNMSQTVERMGGKGLSQQELIDLEQFLLRGLEAPANPHLAADGQLTPDQLAGKAIFESKETGCANCHQPERNFTDGISHDVGTANRVELTRFEFERASNPDARPPWLLDTPTLKGLYYTAPYFHDGSAPTLWDVLEREGSRMGETDHLTTEQKQQLIAYLLTL